MAIHNKQIRKQKKDAISLENPEEIEKPQNKLDQKSKKIRKQRTKKKQY